MVASSSGRSNKIFVAPEIVEALRQISDMIKELQKTLKRVKSNTPVAKSKGGKDTLTQVDHTCGGGPPVSSQVDHTCGIDPPEGDKEVTTEHICEVLAKIRRWIQYIEEVVCSAEAGTTLPFHK
ncbi:MAG: hypothetical protein JSW03_08005 [Candidatus Eiseniibacteriota bacterium]|nr:MAG: hypothetical protein JSW03_08005 [Candidatus Eisenbacteria bacterium]